ncbi:MAG: hypothetical protein IPK19_28035 [Chloroflexi bacterium]|nr:hypothetical protein [Chloroflexota bacterium]
MPAVERMRGSVLGNVATKGHHGVAEQDALVFGEFLGLGNSDPEAIKHAPRTEVQYPLYQSLSEQDYLWAAFLNRQRRRQAMVKTDDGRTRRIWTLAIHANAPQHVVERFKLASLRRFGRPVSIVNAELRSLFVPVPGNATGEFYEPIY